MSRKNSPRLSFARKINVTIKGPNEFVVSDIAPLEMKSVFVKFGHVFKKLKRKGYSREEIKFELVKNVISASLRKAAHHLSVQPTRLDYQEIVSRAVEIMEDAEKKTPEEQHNMIQELNQYLQRIFGTTKKRLRARDGQTIFYEYVEEYGKLLNIFDTEVMK